MQNTVSSTPWQSREYLQQNVYLKSSRFLTVKCSQHSAFIYLSSQRVWFENLVALISCQTTLKTNKRCKICNIKLKVSVGKFLNFCLALKWKDTIVISCKRREVKSFLLAQFVVHFLSYTLYRNKTQFELFNIYTFFSLFCNWYMSGTENQTL